MATNTNAIAKRPLLKSAGLASLLLSMLIGVAVDAATYYVAPNGNDSNPGSISQPFRTIGKGTSVLRSGDTLFLRAGVYDANIGSHDFPGGSSSQHTVIAGYPGENPVIRCSRGNCGNFDTVITLSRNYITLQDFTIDVINGAAGGMCAYLGPDVLFQRITCINAPRDAIRVVGENTIIRNSHIKDCGRIQDHPDDTKGLGIHANSNGDSHTSNLLIENNLIEGCRAGGMGIQQAPETRNVVVRNNILRNFGTYSPWPQSPVSPPQSGTGINFAHGSYFYAYNNLIYNVGGEGSDCFLAWGDGRRHGSFFYFYNNTCNNTETGIVVWDQANNITARNNIFSNMRTVHRLGNASNNSNTNYLTNPIYVDPSAGDFHLKQGSPGINQGANLSPIVTTDMDGTSRPQGASYDIGAYEYAASAVPVTSVPSSPANVNVAPF